jgi:tetratricopeptide (TPR) repeat protein
MRIARASGVALAALVFCGKPGAGQVKPALPLDVLETQVRSDSNNPEIHYQLGLGYWARRRWDDAERAFQTAVSIHPRSAKAQLGLAMVPYARREQLWGEAIDGRVPANLVATVEASDRRIRLAFMIDPLVSQLLIGAVQLDPTRYFPQTWEAQEFRDLVFKWHEDFYQDRFGSAYSGLQRLIREADWARGRDKIPAYVRWVRGLAAAHVARFDSAIADIRVLYQRAVDQQESDTIVHIPLRTNEYRYILAVLHRDAGAVDSAITLFQQAAENDIGLFMAHVHLAEIYESQGKLEEAIRERQAAIAANPDEASLYYEAGTSLLKVNRLEEALEMMTSARRSNPREPQSPFAAAVIQLSLGHNAEARESLEHFIAIAPTYMSAQVDRARQQLAALTAQDPAPRREP